MELSMRNMFSIKGNICSECIRPGRALHTPPLTRGNSSQLKFNCWVWICRPLWFRVLKKTHAMSATLRCAFLSRRCIMQKCREKASLCFSFGKRPELWRLYACVPLGNFQLCLDSTGTASSAYAGGRFEATDNFFAFFAKRGWQIPLRGV